MITLYTTTDVIILIDPATGAIVRAAYDVPRLQPALLTANPGTVPITGQAAALLFQAASGRTINQPPELASPELAREAKHKLIDQPHLAGYQHAVMALSQIGFEINPNLGLTLLSDNGEIIPNTRYLLPISPQVAV